MTEPTPSKPGKWILPFLSFSLLLALAIIGTFSDPHYVGGASTQNVTVLLNVTNTEPTAYDAIVDDLNPSPADQIDLTAGARREVFCNTSASDPNGQADLVNATAELYTTTAGMASARSNSTHYFNSSCLEFFNVAGAPNNRTFTCRFNLEYFATNTTWECNMTVRDFGGTQTPASKIFLNTSYTDQVVVNSLLAINITKTILDYGNLSVTETSAEQNINITNVGNVLSNFTVLGYGGDNKSLENAGNSSMLCQLNNISIGQHRYSNVSGINWLNMLNLSYNATLFANATLKVRVNETDPVAPNSTSPTYWKIRVPLSVGGSCNGTIQFAATG